MSSKEQDFEKDLVIPKGKIKIWIICSSPQALFLKALKLFLHIFFVCLFF